MAEKLDYPLLRMFDCYQGLLTDRQREVMELYYNDDCSLSEIAALHGISRQAVSDSLRHSRQILTETEAQLGLAGRLEELRRTLVKLQCAAQAHSYDTIIQLAEHALEQIESQEG